MKKLTAVLVDDFPQALTLLTNDIKANHKAIEIIGTADSVVSAAKLLHKTQPDILFLDIVLGDGTGFDILEIVPNLTSKIIFVSASDAFAIKAFKFSAIDYILKPYTKKDLEMAIKKVISHLQPSKEQLNILKQAIDSPKTTPEKISLHTQEKIIVVDLKNIIRCKADNNYTTFYFVDGSSVIVSKTLKFYADILKEVQFLRVHQSHLVNIKFIMAFIKSDGGYLLLKDKCTVPVSVRKRSEVLKALDAL